MEDRTPREIEYENEVIDMDYLQEKFDEDESVVPKEIDEEIDLLKNLQVNNKEPPPKIVKEDIATLKAKVKRKQQKNISHLSEDQKQDPSSRSSYQPTEDGAKKEDTLPIVTKTTSSSLRSKNHPSSDQYPPSHPSGPNHSSGTPGHREKASQETKLPHLPTQRNKPLTTTPGSQKKSLFKKRSNDAIASEEKDNLKSMEILKRREEEILRAKAKREKLLQEQAEYLPASEFEPLTAMRQGTSSSKKTKKKKEVKEVSLFSSFCQ